MSTRARLALMALIAAVMLTASACKVKIGYGCEIWIEEPGVRLGLVCNDFRLF